MKVRVLSDLHLEFGHWVPPKSDADVVVLAGDIHVGMGGLEWARRAFPLTPVVYVPGNHEFYGRDLEELGQELLLRGRRLGVDVLDGRNTVIGGVRFLGATLWTDFALLGLDAGSIECAMVAAQYRLNDFQLIRYTDNRLFQPTDAAAIHRERIQWLRTQLAVDHVQTTVVVTHHLPHPQSIHPKYEGSDLNPSFASDCSELMGPPVSLWIHGHTHESFDYAVNGTRIICNPRGYAPTELNPAFDPALTVDLPPAESSRGGLNSAVVLL